MRIQSIRATIKIRHIACNRLFCLAVKMTFRKMHAIAEGHYLPQEIRAMAEALQYPRHLLPARLRAPFVIDFREFTGRICVLNKFDLVFHFLVHHRRASFVDLPIVRTSKRAQMVCRLRLWSTQKPFSRCNSVVVLPILYREEQQSQGVQKSQVFCSKKKENAGRV